MDKLHEVDPGGSGFNSPSMKKPEFHMSSHQSFGLLDENLINGTFENFASILHNK